MSSTAGELCVSLAACGDTLAARMTSLEGSLQETVALARKAEAKKTAPVLNACINKGSRIASNHNALELS